jgi:hypothetical protein
MRCIGCGSTAVSERNERTAQGYRRFRCRRLPHYRRHSGTGQVMPITAARRRYSDTVLRLTPIAAAIRRSLRPVACLRRRTFRT